jgi:hypothetical protein
MSMQAPLTPENLPLRDIHLPTEISWWPPAPGWWLLLLGLFLLVAIGYWFWCRWQRRRYQRLALFKIQELEQQYCQHEDHKKLLAELSRLLRQTALLHFPTANCAGLTGDNWLTFLDQRMGKETFSQGVGRALATGPYLVQTPEVDVSALLKVCRSWVRCLPPVPKPDRRQR